MIRCCEPSSTGIGIIVYKSNNSPYLVMLQLALFLHVRMPLLSVRSLWISDPEGHVGRERTESQLEEE